MRERKKKDRKIEVIIPKMMKHRKAANRLDAFHTLLGSVAEDGDDDDPHYDHV